MLRQRRTHQKTTIAAAFDGQMRRTGVVMIDQIAGAGYEVIEDVLLLRQISGLVPFFPELAATAQIGDGVHTALIEPPPPQCSEPGLEADVVAAVTGEQRRIRAVESRVFPSNDVQRYFREVF